jgi:hypothetical protein
MIKDPGNYSLFFRFIETFLPGGFKGIDRNDQLLQKMEEVLKNGNQFFFIADVIQVKILFSSNGSVRMLGIEPEDVTPYHFFEATHPDDIQRHNLGRSKLFSLAQNIFIEKKGNVFLSTNLKIRNPLGDYTLLLFQCYLFYAPEPLNTVYVLQLHTDISWFTYFKYGYHFYVGNDLSYFRYPDKELLMTGNIFSDREFEIIRLVKSGLNSEQIGEKLFLSRHTINTHRKNILKKSGKAHISDLIYDLKERGVI